MSKIETEFKLKDLYAIKHALEIRIDQKYFIINKLNNIDFDSPSYIIENQDKVEKLILDIEHEKKIVDYIVEVINKYKSTKQHYDKKEGDIE